MYGLATKLIHRLIEATLVCDQRLTQNIHIALNLVIVVFFCEEKKGLLSYSNLGEYVKQPRERRQPGGKLRVWMSEGRDLFDLFILSHRHV